MRQTTPASGWERLSTTVLICERTFIMEVLEEGLLLQKASTCGLAGKQAPPLLELRCGKGHDFGQIPQKQSVRQRRMCRHCVEEALPGENPRRMGQRLRRRRQRSKRWLYPQRVALSCSCRAIRGPSSRQRSWARPLAEVLPAQGLP